MSGDYPGSTPASSSKLPATAENSPASYTVELPVPEGWRKLYSPLNNEVVFIAPTGEEIKTMNQLELYLKSHPGGTQLSAFYGGSGDTPGRSSTIREMAVSTLTPTAELPGKRSIESSGRTKAAKKMKGNEGDKSIKEEDIDDEKEMDEANFGEGETEGMEDDMEIAEYDEGEVKMDTDHDKEDKKPDQQGDEVTTSAAVQIEELDADQFDDQDVPHISHYIVIEPND